MSISSDRFRPKATETRPETLQIDLDFGEPLTLPLSHARACDPMIAGNKAANLARAAVAGLPTLPGFVITTWGAKDIRARRGKVEELQGDKRSLLKAAWEVLSFEGTRPLVVRSSSSGEDMEGSSMAGRFISVLGVRTWLDFISAVEQVINSADVVHLDDATEPVPIAVLVQPELSAATGGIMFGVDPVSGRKDRLVVSAVAGGPDQLVSGAVDGTQYTMARSGRKVQGPRRGENLLSIRQRLALVKLADETQRTFGGPQDMEWAFDSGGKLWLFQSRPVTAVATEAEAKGPLLGPGPVAETFPLQLSALEEDLWLPPLRAAIQTALSLTGAASRKRIATSPVVSAVNGWAVADLELLGATERRKNFWQRIDPRPPCRRLAASWRVGRLRAALPSIADDLVRRTDEELARVPIVRRPSSEELLRILRRSRQVLIALHGHEVLAGLISEDESKTATSAGLAMQLLRQSRDAGLTDEEITAAHPEVLALVPPSIGSPAELPPTPSVQAAAQTMSLGHREALRLRIRWVHELTSLIAHELGWRLACNGYLTGPDELRSLTLEDVERVVRLGDYSEPKAEPRPVTAPPPSIFRLAPDGTPVPEKSKTKGSAARGAGGGRGAGPVHLGTEPKPGDVLVVKVLDPSLATILPGLGGLVSETGSVLSHLAILAREYGVPTVVGVADATERFAEGTRILVDGTTGEVGPVSA